MRIIRLALWIRGRVKHSTGFMLVRCLGSCEVNWHSFGCNSLDYGFRNGSRAKTIPKPDYVYLKSTG